MKDKNEFRIPQGERRDETPSVNDAQLSEARSAVEALAFAQGARNPEVYKDPQALELLAIGQEIEEQRRRTEYGVAA